MIATEDTLQEMTNRIVERFDPEKVVLFGSYARGEAHRHSDVDLLVVLRTAEDKRQACVAIREALRDYPICKDIIVTTPEEIARRGQLVGTILRPALREGKVLYERH